MKSHELIKVVQYLRNAASAVDSADGYDPIEIEHGHMSQALDEIEDLFKSDPELVSFPNFATIKELVDQANSKGLNINYAMSVRQNPNWDGVNPMTETEYIPVNVSEQQFKELHSIMSLIRDKVVGAVAYVEELETQEDLQYQEQWLEGLEQGKDAWRMMSPNEKRKTLVEGMIKGFSYKGWDWDVGTKNTDEQQIRQILEEKDCIRFYGLPDKESNTRDIHVVPKKELVIET
ncbi:MAG: hypothetical protein FWE16_00085 [Firmicutes bacterium]|nr:hypothetical protein [Bacillota bacterium]